MEALIVLLLLLTVVIILGAAAALGGTDSRDGFSPDRLRPNFN